MTGWIRHTAHTTIVRTVVLGVLLSCCHGTSARHIALPMLHDVVITNGLKNVCGKCVRRGCVVHGHDSRS